MTHACIPLNSSPLSQHDSTGNKATTKFCNLKMAFESETLTYIKGDFSTVSKLHCASQLLLNITASKSQTQSKRTIKIHSVSIKI